MVVEYIFDLIGFYSFYVICFLVIVQIFKKYSVKVSLVYVLGFILGGVINQWMNQGLKVLVKDPRPRNPKEMWIPDWNNGSVIWKTDNAMYAGLEEYGFPSGHAQLAFYGLTWIILLGRYQIDVLGWIGILVCLITIIQRFKYRRHTIEQLFGGACFGIAMGWLVVIATKKGLLTILI
jgi:membrane-associated phospholipid phosphatase